MNFARTDTSLLGRWWWTVDRWTVGAVMALVIVGAMLTLAASPSVAERLGADSFHFVRRQFAFLPVAVLTMLAISLLGPVGVRRLAVLGLAAAVLGMAATLLFGDAINGARRWISLGGLSLQPSEFAKPTLAVVGAWLIAAQHDNPRFPGKAIAIALFMLVVGPLLLQPDVGMALVVVALGLGQFFLAGLPLLWVALLLVAAIGGLVGAYFVFPHVASRVDRFLDPATGDNYQVATALRAFHNGGLFGRGPGEGQVKAVLPDAHTDFILAVAGEEFGLLLCLLIVALFVVIVVRGLNRLLREPDLFVLLAAGGLLMLVSLQALVNMASTLRLMPTKGMTLPFISYGGSSLLALSVAMGMLLALTRRRAGPGGMA